MKYNTISTASLAAEGKKRSLAMYADADSARDKMLNSEAEIIAIRNELEMVQRALKLQTKRCQNLVTEYTRRLQEKERQYQSEKLLRDDQLARVLRALLLFEARLKQEQKFISHQLSEKDYIIKKQSCDIKRLLSERYCKNCKTYYSPTSNLESLDSSSEYVITDYQSSNFESLDSSSETYATISEKEYSGGAASNGDPLKTDSEASKAAAPFMKNKSNKDSFGKRSKRLGHRKSIGTYFEVLKLRSGSISPFSNEDNTSNDYDNLDSLPAESVLSEKLSSISQEINNDVQIETSSEQNDSSINISVSEYNSTVIARSPQCEDNKIETDEKKPENNQEEVSNKLFNNLEDEPVNTFNSSKITDLIPVFEGDNNDANDNWYASASDQDDEEQRNVYRNNPVLECMNQILLQNISDSLSSPPKTPNVERKGGKTKRVKFSDEEDNKNAEEIKTVQDEIEIKPPASQTSSDYYETPIQKLPNFYETPQSIYSNDYEQIMSKSSESLPTKIENKQEREVNKMATKKLSVLKNIDFDNSDQTSNHSHLYIDMDARSENEEQEHKPIRRSKILRTPPALPPKPINLMSKHKIRNSPIKINKESDAGLDSEPDYCSISELNLPTRKVSKTVVVAEINGPPNEPINESSSATAAEKGQENDGNYDPVIVNEVVPSLVVRKNIEKFNVQIAKQTNIKNSPKNKISSIDIPKLPQVSEIIIPDETEPKQEERISVDNYVKNNSSMLKQKQNRYPIVIGSSVSALITGFNNQQLLSEINLNKQEKPKESKRAFASFENVQNIDKHSTIENVPETCFDNFDLSQNFEEFKLDDCEIGDDISEIADSKNENEVAKSSVDIKVPPLLQSNSISSTRVDLIRATNNDVVPKLNINSIEHLRKKLELQRNQNSLHQNKSPTESLKQANNSPTYEHFLECTGLSSKSILTPSRLLSNHKSMLKPKDVKLRSKVAKSSAIIHEKQGGGTIKYWSEPYV